MTDTTFPILGRIGRMLTLGSMKRLKSPCSVSVKMSAITESICCSILLVLFPRSKSLVWQGRDNWFHQWVPAAASCKCCRRAANNHHDHHLQHHHHHHVFFKCRFFYYHHHRIWRCHFLDKTLHQMLSRVTRPQMKSTNEDKLSRKVSWFS